MGLSWTRAELLGDHGDAGACLFLVPRRPQSSWGECTPTSHLALHIFLPLTCATPITKAPTHLAVQLALFYFLLLSPHHCLTSHSFFFKSFSVRTRMLSAYFHCTPSTWGGQHKQWLHQHAEQICNGAGPYGVFLGQIPTLPLAPESSACLLSVEKLSLPGLPRATKA